ncbi:MAG: G-D-S-L family lipolytic protein [Flavobacteriales bacterium]|nr:G-D-S-L family lipolytic protein [Flavobacteriales bacterium]
MKTIYLKSLFILLSLAFWSCNEEFKDDVDNQNVTSGNADFSNYVSLGNSLTAGYRDGTLYKSGQLESYPNMLATQMKLAGGGEFKQPLIPNDIGGFLGFDGFDGKLTLQVVTDPCTSSTSLSPVASNPTSGLDNISAGGSYNNMGIPGALVSHLIAPGFGNPAGLISDPPSANPYFIRMASSTSTSVIQDAIAQNPTFFSLWIGANDVLGYARTGGDGSKSITPSEGAVGYGFDSTYSVLLDQLTTNGAKGVVANLPYVTSIPFFTTVPYNPIQLSEAQATQISTSIAPILQVLKAYGQEDRIVLPSATESNPLLIKDETLDDLSNAIASALTPVIGSTLATQYGAIYGQARSATSNDLILLTTSSIIGKDPASVNSCPSATATLLYGITYPLEDSHVLIPSEIDAILTATNSYNTTIKNLANKYNLAFVDANAKMQELNSNSGITFNGVNYTSTFVTGGAFSLDGVHPNGRGYAIIANEFIKAINGKYDSTLPLVNPNNYTGVAFP